MRPRLRDFPRLRGSEYLDTPPLLAFAKPQIRGLLRDLATEGSERSLIGDSAYAAARQVSSRSTGKSAAHASFRLFMAAVHSHCQRVFFRPK